MNFDLWELLSILALCAGMLAAYNIGSTEGFSIMRDTMRQQVRALLESCFGAVIFYSSGLMCLSDCHQAYADVATSQVYAAFTGISAALNFLPVGFAIFLGCIIIMTWMRSLLSYLRKCRQHP